MPGLNITNEREAKRFLTATFKLRRKPKDKVPSWAWRVSTAGVLQVVACGPHAGAIVTTETHTSLDPFDVWRVPEREALDRMYRGLGSAPCFLAQMLVQIPTAQDDRGLNAVFPPFEKILGACKRDPAPEDGSGIVDIDLLDSVRPLVALHTDHKRGATLTVKAGGSPSVLVSVLPWVECVIMGRRQ